MTKSHGAPAAGGYHHKPVMLTEVLEVFEVIETGVVVDATVGGAGHSSALLEAHDELELVGLDRDPVAVAVATERLARFGPRAKVCRARFDEIARVLDDLGIASISGVLFDLGVSSHQLDEPDRGFGYRVAGPLDMRMDQTSGRSAAEMVNELGEAELADILFAFGDERHSRRIARAIVGARPVTTTAALAAIVAEAMPARSRRSPGHPARRTFQALRIAVNEELDVIEPALVAAVRYMAVGGRGAVLSYHSGEDRIVKRVLRRLAGLDVELPRGLPVEPSRGAVELLNRGARRPSAPEVEANPRASAARLRAFEKIGSTDAVEDPERSNEH